MNETIMLFKATRTLSTMLMVIGLLASGFAAAADQEQHIGGDVPMYFRQSNGRIEIFSHKNYAAFQQAFERQFSWESSLHSTTETHGYLVFLPNASLSDPERIVYDVRVYNGGMVILGMHTRLTGVREDLIGDKIFDRTFGILSSN